MQSSFDIQSFIFKGNIDTKHLTVGSTLFLPVQAPGALFSIGVSTFTNRQPIPLNDHVPMQDGHAAQGDGGQYPSIPLHTLYITYPISYSQKSAVRVPRSNTTPHIPLTSHTPPPRNCHRNPYQSHRTSHRAQKQTLRQDTPLLHGTSALRISCPW